MNGTRQRLGPAFANDDYDASIGNSNYNSFQATLRHSAKGLSFLVGIYLQQIHRPGVRFVRSDQSVQLRCDAGAFRFRSEAQLGGQLRLPTSARSSVQPREGPDARMGDFGNHARDAPVFP